MHIGCQSFSNNFPHDCRLNSTTIIVCECVANNNCIRKKNVNILPALYCQSIGVIESCLRHPASIPGAKNDINPKRMSCFHFMIIFRMSDMTVTSAQFQSTSGLYRAPLHIMACSIVVVLPLSYYYYSHSTSVWK